MSIETGALYSKVILLPASYNGKMERFFCGFTSNGSLKTAWTISGAKHFSFYSESALKNVIERIRKKGVNYAVIDIGVIRSVGVL
jgi:hypothetical protein